MSQIDFIRATVSDFFDALIDSDLADNGMFYAPETDINAVDFDPSAGDPCRVLIKRGVRPFGEFGSASGQSFEIRLVNADVPTSVQRRGSHVSVESASAGLEYFKLVERLADNGALATWSVVHE